MKKEKRLARLDWEVNTESITTQNSLLDWDINTGTPQHKLAQSDCDINTGKHTKKQGHGSRASQVVVATNLCLSL